MMLAGPMASSIAMGMIAVAIIEGGFGPAAVACDAAIRHGSTIQLNFRAADTCV
jgi:hypothetical protein